MSRALAIALGYRPESDLAPRIVATGAGRLADRILWIAAEHGVPCEHDPELAALLAPLEVDEEVPPELYEVVARIFAFLLRVGEREGPAAGD